MIDCAGKAHDFAFVTANNAKARRFVPIDARTPPDVHFLSFAGHLQRIVGARSVGLPVDKLASMLAVSSRTVSTYRRWAVRARILRQVAMHSREHHRSAQFSFDLTLFDAEGRQRGLESGQTSDVATPCPV